MHYFRRARPSLTIRVIPVFHNSDYVQLSPTTTPSQTPHVKDLIDNRSPVRLNW